MKTRLLTAAVIALGLTLLASPAGAAPVTPKEGIRELDRSRALIDRSLELYRAGESERAYEAARNAYLDHFEFVEIPLRVRDEALTLELEEDYALLRGQIESGASVTAVEASAAELRAGLDRVERTLAEPGLAAPLIALGASFVILFREGFEAVLVVAAVLGYLEASRATQYRGAVLKGVAGAVVASVLTFGAASLLLSIAPVQQELLEAVTAIVAVVVLFYVSFWLVQRLEHRRWMEFVKAKVWAATSSGSALALGAVGFTAVYREGFETALFYQALLSFAQGLEQWVAVGAAAGVVVLAAVAYLVLRAGKRLPVKAFLTTAVALVMVLSVAFVGNAVRALQQSAVVSVTFLEDVPRLPIFVAELTGLHPTRESLLAQGALALVYAAGALWTFVLAPRRERRYTGPEHAATAEAE
jgi:high-affinity iron transporter